MVIHMLAEVRLIVAALDIYSMHEHRVLEPKNLTMFCINKRTCSAHLSD